MSVPRALLTVLLLVAISTARAELAVPVLTARVTDQTATLSAAQQANLEQLLAAFESRKGSQIAVLIVPTTGTETIEQYALRVADQWRIGRRKVDDGAILVVAKQDHALRIEVGYGLEGALNDATCKRIISEVIVPRFKHDDFPGGIAAGVEQMVKVVEGEPLPAPAPAAARDGASVQHFFPIIFIITLVLGEIARATLGRMPGAFVTGGLVFVLAWFLLGALVMAAGIGVVASLFTLFGGALGRGMGGGFGGRGGGFSGGGGSFGGGGASGRW